MSSPIIGGESTADLSEPPDSLRVFMNPQDVYMTSSTFQDTEICVHHQHELPDGFYNSLLLAIIYLVTLTPLGMPRVIDVPLGGLKPKRRSFDVFIPITLLDENTHKYATVNVYGWSL